MSNRLSPAQKAWITRKIKSGKSKYETSKELNICYQTILRITKDLPGHSKGRNGIRGGTLRMLQDLLKDGYTFFDTPSDSQKYYTLKKYFPTVQRTRYEGCSILFLEDRSNLAVKAFLMKIRKNIISYQELKNITKIFNIELSKNEKDMFISKKRLGKN